MCFYHLVSGELWVAVGQFSGREHWEAVAHNLIITHPALAVEVMDPETGICRYMQPHIQEFVVKRRWLWFARICLGHAEEC